MKAKKKNVKKSPAFAEKEQLTRYIDKDELKRGGRVSSTAFLPNPGDLYLSVNNVELEPLFDIACYYRKRFQEGLGKVAIASRKVYEYNNAATHVGISISYNKLANRWEYATHEGTKVAYKHRGVPPPLESYSHCGVEYINTNLDELALDKIARRLAGNRPQLYQMEE
jgi:hypothetical protein